MLRSRLTRINHEFLLSVIEKQQSAISDLKYGDFNILHEPHFDIKKIIFPTVHIKQGFMKQCIKALPIEGECFKNCISEFFAYQLKKKNKVSVHDSAAHHR